MSNINPLVISLILTLILHSGIWFSINYQFSDNAGNMMPLFICVVLAIPISVCGFFSTKFAYEYFQSAWSAKFFGFAIGYVVFSILTWMYLSENPFSIKNVTTIILAFTIVGIQLFFHNS